MSAFYAIKMGLISGGLSHDLDFTEVLSVQQFFLCGSMAVCYLGYFGGFFLDFQDFGDFPMVFRLR
jgi:hypothetical protein